MIRKLSILMIALFIVCLTANAQSKKHTRKARVVNGIKTGQISKREAVVIRAEHKDVKEAKAKGTSTPAQKKAILQERREVNRAIIRAKNNNRTRQ